MSPLPGSGGMVLMMHRLHIYNSRSVSDIVAGEETWRKPEAKCKSLFRVLAGPNSCRQENDAHVVAVAQENEATVCAKYYIAV